MIKTIFQINYQNNKIVSLKINNENIEKITWYIVNWSTTWQLRNTRQPECRAGELPSFWIYVSVWAWSHLMCGHRKKYNVVYVGWLQLKRFILQGRQGIEFLSSEMDGYVVIYFRLLESSWRSINHPNVTICFFDWKGFFRHKHWISPTCPKVPEFPCFIPWN